MVLITDPVGDLLTRIRNAVLSGRRQVRMPLSKMKESIGWVLKEEGFLEEVKVGEGEKGGKYLELVLAYSGRKPVISGLKRVSTPGRRVYRGVVRMGQVLGGAGISLVSTSCGVMSDRKAKKAKLGGEILAEVW